MNRPIPDPVSPGQESVWDYPRPPVIEPVDRRLRIVHRGVLVAESTDAIRYLETSHPPSYYIPPDDIDQTLLQPAAGSSFCEWKGVASYVDVVVGADRFRKVGWYYPEPVPDFRAIANHIAFYCAPFDECWVGDELARPQPGNFYGGWITSDVVGPFKGGPGSGGW